ncbi:MAG: NUDIX domain-containing protein [archaeon]
MKRGSDRARMLTEREWRFVVLKMPMPCVDVIVERHSEILMGFRAIPPYRNVWALPGGVIRKHEDPKDTIRRVLEENAVEAQVSDFVGLFPVRFPRHPQKRYDIACCYVARWVSGEPRSSDELIRVDWFPPERLPSPIGKNYARMIKQAVSTNQLSSNSARS